MYILDIDLRNTSPRSIVFTFSFWVKNFSLIILISLGGALFYTFWQHNYLRPQTEIMEDPASWAITFALVFMLLWGIWQAILLVARLEIEASCTDYLSKKTVEESNNQLTHEQIRNLLPGNLNSAANSLFRHIWMSARIDQFESTSVTLQPCKETIILQQQAISDLQKMSLHLGILGTFVGLVKSFLGLHNDSFNFQDIKLALEYGFSTSVFGLFISLFLGVLIYHIDYQRMAFFAFLEKVSDEFLHLVCRAKNEDPVLEHKYSMLKNHIELMAARTDEQTKFIREGLDKLADTRKQFEGILDSVGKREAAFLAEMKSAYDFFSPEMISNNLHQSLSSSVKNITDELHTHLHETLDRYTEVNSGLTAMRDHFIAFDEQIRNKAASDAELVGKLKAEVFESLNQVAKAQKEFAEQFNTKRVQTGLEKSIREAGNQVTAEYIRALGEMLPHLQSLNANISEFNRKAYAEVRQRDTVQLLRGVGQNLSELFMRIIRAFLSLFSKA